MKRYDPFAALGLASLTGSDLEILANHPNSFFEEYPQEMSQVTHALQKISAEVEQAANREFFDQLNELITALAEEDTLTLNLS